MTAAKYRKYHKNVSDDKIIIEVLVSYTVKAFYIITGLHC